MKKYSLFAAAVAALVALSCSKEPADVNPADNPEGEVVTLTAGIASDADGTRTVRQADGKVFWSPADAISVLRGSTNAKFTSSNTEPAATAEFTGTMPSGSDAFWAKYPYDAEDYIDGNYLVTSLPAEQEAVAGSFADDLFISAALVKNNATYMTLYHQCGGIKFSVTQPGIKKVTLIPADENVYPAGLIAIYASLAGQVPYIGGVGYPDYMSSTVELTAPEGQTLEVGEAYHIVTIPVYMTGGFSLLFEKEDGSFATRVVRKDVEIRAARFATLMEADKGIVFRKDYIDYSPSAVSIDGLGGTFAIDVQGDLEYTIESNAAWIQEVTESGDLRVKRSHVFVVERNEGEERKGVLSICFGENCYPIMVTQSAMGDLKVYPHHSLGMRFTATWCQYCPYMDETFRKAKDAMGDAFEYVCLYDTGGNYGFEGMPVLADRYLVSGLPAAIIDGWYDLPNYSSTDYGSQVLSMIAEETAILYPTATAIGIESSLSGRNLSVKVDVKAQYEEGYKLTVFLCENGIIGNQQSTSGVISDFEHSRVTRMSLTEYTGDEFDGPAAGGVKTFNFTATIPSGYKTENMDIVAFVQRSFKGRGVVQTGFYGDWYVDNCRVAALGATAPLEVE